MKEKRSVDAPEDNYKNKETRVNGPIVIEDDLPYIKVDDGKQLDLVGET